MAGKLYGVGVGPGDPQLLTLKAVKIIESCEIIGIPSRKKETCTAYQIAKGAVPLIEEKEIVCIPVPMMTDEKKLESAYQKGSALLESFMDKGKNIAFLNLGDPTVYGSYMTIHAHVRKDGYEAEIVNGVPSFCAVAATLELSLGTRNENIHILPGCYDEKEITKEDGTKVLMKSAGKIGEVKKKLLELESSGQAKAYAVVNCGMKDQKVCEDIQKLDESAGYFTTVILKDQK